MSEEKRKGEKSVAISTFLIMDRVDAVQYCQEQHKEKAALISINSCGQRPARITKTQENGVISVLRLFFDDVVIGPNSFDEDHANEVVEKMKHKAGKKKRRIPKGLTKKEKAGLVSKILEVLEKQVPDFWKKLKDVADAFFKEKGAALLTYGENGKICYTPLFRSIILQSLPGFFSQKRPNGLVTAFFDALYAA